MSRRDNWLVGKAIGKMLSHWGSAKELWAGVEKKQSAAEGRGSKRKTEVQKGHQWAWTGVTWRCQVCLKQSHTRIASECAK
eukprot:4070621-Karenia_brevis.AAC.1